MTKVSFEKMSLDDLWALHEQISHVLSSRILAEKEQLEKRLLQLNRGENATSPVLAGVKSAFAKSDRPRRKYPKVFAKYRNPAKPSETWSGRGKRPRWLVSALNSGKLIEDFEILRGDKESVDG